MIPLRSFGKYWLPVLIWMAVIFSASGDTKSFNRSSRIIGPLVKLIYPSISEENLDRVVTLIRKCAHLTEYAILAALFWRALEKPAWRNPKPWNRNVAIAAVIFVALYAATDEFHQSLVPGRQGQFSDVVIDTIGGIGGMLLVWTIWRIRCRRVQPAS